MDRSISYIEHSIPKHHNTPPPSYDECIPNMPKAACAPPQITDINLSMTPAAACAPPPITDNSHRFCKNITQDDYFEDYTTAIKNSPGNYNYIVCSNCDHYFTTYIYPDQIAEYICAKCNNKKKTKCINWLFCWCK